MKRWWITSVVMMLAVSSAPAVSQQSTSKTNTSNLQQEVVARVGDRIITLAEFNRIIARETEGGGLPPEKKKALLDKYVNQLLFLEGAKRMRLAERPEVAARMEEAAQQVLVNEYLKLKIVDPAKVSETEIKTYWKEHRNDYLAPLQVRARHILIAVAPGGENDAEARARAETLLPRIRAGENFAELASQLSDDIGTKLRGGDLGYFTSGKMAPAFEQAAFALKPGEVSEPVKTSFGYHLIKVEERREPAPRPYEAAREMINAKLAREKQIERFEGTMAELKANLKIEVNPRIFDVEE